MPVEAVLISGPAIDFNTFLSLTHEAMGYNLAEVADTSGRKMVDLEKYLMCLAAFKDRRRPKRSLPPIFCLMPHSASWWSLEHAIRWTSSK